MPMDAYDSSTWLLVLNPVSGRGAGLRDRARIEAALTAEGLVFRAAVSAHHGHTTTLVGEAIARGCRRILVAGGDGSLSEAVNGICAQAEVPPEDVRLALLPVGTGNDWARAQGVPQGYAAAARVAATGSVRPHDAGVIDFAAGGRRWFINVAGMGFDSGVIERMPTRRLGRLAYLIGLARELVQYRPVTLRWRQAGVEKAAEAFVQFACIGTCCGGGMRVAPQADCADGLLDFVLIRHMGRLAVLRALPVLFDGTLHRHPKVETWRAGRTSFAGPPDLAIEADGELVGRGPATFSVLQGALRVVVPAAPTP